MLGILEENEEKDLAKRDAPRLPSDAAIVRPAVNIGDYVDRRVA